MKSLLGKTIAVTALALMMGSAIAQTNGPTGISARLGAFFPTNKLSTLGSTWFGFGADYKLDALQVGKPMYANTKAYIGFTADYYSYGGNSNIPLALTYNIRAGQTLFALGAGLDFYNIDDLSKSGTGFGLQASYTYEFGKIGETSNPLFLQAKYFLSERKELRGFGAYIGVRF